MRLKSLCLIFAFAIAPAQPLASQPIFSGSSPTYADLADLALASPVVAHVRVDRSDALSEREAPNVPAGHRRFLVDASIVALIRADGQVPTRVAYLVDLPNDASGRAARIRRRSEFLLLASSVPGRPGELRLTAPDAQLPFTPETAARLRAILTEAVAADAPPAIIGIGRSFNVQGTLPGESETQIFLQTADQRPISLNVLRRPGQEPRWSVALGEMVDDAAEPPRPDSLLWYRLACRLPATLPPQSLEAADPREREAIEADYRIIRDGLGECRRSRG